MSRSKKLAFNCSFIHITVFATTFVLGVFLIFNTPNIRGTLVDKWSDHTSNILSTQIFWKIGFRIYSEPTEAFKYLLGHRFNEIVSPMLPRHYPPGLWIILFPIAFAEQHEWIRIDLANRLTLALYFLFALATIYLLFQRISTYKNKLSSPLEKNILTVFALLSSIELVRWALNGMYDPISIFLILLSIKAYECRRFSCSLTFYSLSLFIHFRALWLAPLPIFALVNYLKYSSRSILSKILNPSIIFSVVLSLLSLGSFVLAAPGLKYLPINNYFYIGLPSNIHWLRLSLFLILTLNVSYIYYASGESLALSCIIWTSIMWLLTPLIQQWYVLFLIPIATLLLSHKSETPHRISWVYLMVFWWTTISILLMRNSPFEFRFFHEIINLWMRK